MLVKLTSATIVSFLALQLLAESQKEKTGFSISLDDALNQAVVVHSVNLRRDPSIDNPPISKLHVHDSVSRVGQCRNGFCKVKTEEGVVGWVWEKNILSKLSMLGDFLPYHSGTEFNGLGPHLFGLHANNFTGNHMHIFTGLDAAIDLKPLLVVQDILDSLPTGDLAFNHPSEMNLGQEQTLKVLVSPQLKTNLDLMRKRLQFFGGLISFDTVKLSSSMKCNLQGEHFKITANTHDEQLISEKDLTEWDFTVIPQESGLQTLRLVVSVVVKLPDGKEKTRDFPVKEETVRVRVTPALRLKLFVQAQWQWVLTTLIAPLGGWWWKKRRDRKRQQAGFVPRAKSAKNAK